MIRTIQDNTNFLRRALKANGMFSAVSGLVLLFAAEPISYLLGLTLPSILMGIGAALLIYAVALFRNAVQQSLNYVEVWVAVVLDGAWVVGSGLLILTGLLSVTGNWLVALVADIVLVFGILQFYGLRKIERARIGEC